MILLILFGLTFLIDESLDPKISQLSKVSHKAILCLVKNSFLLSILSPIGILRMHIVKI